MGFDFAALRQSFFDAEGLAKKIDAGKRRALSKCGAFVRTRARSSIRKRKAITKGGQGKPPSSHKGQLRFIFFSYDPAADSVVVGPIEARSKTQNVRAPRLLEKTGRVVRQVAEPKPPGGVRRAASAAQKAAFRRKVKDGSIVVPPRQRAPKSFYYRGNPFMVPAVEKEAPNFPNEFQGILR